MRSNISPLCPFPTLLVLHAAVSSSPRSTAAPLPRTPSTRPRPKESLYPPSRTPPVPLRAKPLVVRPVPRFAARLSPSTTSRCTNAPQACGGGNPVTTSQTVALIGCLTGPPACSRPLSPRGIRPIPSRPRRIGDRYLRPHTHPVRSGGSITKDAVSAGVAEPPGTSPDPKSVPAGDLTARDMYLRHLLVDRLFAIPY